jgi:bifunctional UDP-N-acetylglucosamine pyrophosphorylase/glucosamine-1-phosphate N-acetyltransferase
VGADCNIGAGTIFANYDGQAKHQTVLQSGVQVGSGSILVAPVTVGAGAYSGAGALIRDDVSPGALVYSPNQQLEIADWVRAKRPGSKAAQAAEQVKEN